MSVAKTVIAIVLPGLIAFGLITIWQQQHTIKNPRSIDDRAGTFSRGQITAIQDYHRALLKEHDIDYRILIPAEIPDVDIDTYAHMQFNGRRIGSLSQTGRGLLLLIDPLQNEVRLEVSTTLEGVYTDAFVSYIQHRQMIPFFRTGRVSDGILATTEMIVTRAQDAQADNAFSPPATGKSMGGGVANPAQIGTGEDRTFRQGAAHLPTANDPRSVLEAYQQAMDDRNGNPSLSIYTEASKGMMAHWTVTPAQMDNEAKKIKECPTGITSINDVYAVIRYPVKKRQCPPYFFMLEDGSWRLDLTMMQKAIRFNHRNQWHFDLKYEPAQGPYAFAFEEWRFDQFGFPHEP